jgi:hypothetical protein
MGRVDLACGMHAGKENILESWVEKIEGMTPLLILRLLG